MKRIRIGNDINVAWSILQKDGTPFSLEGRDVNVFLRTPFGKQEVSDYIINNNVIEWTFLGKTQKVKGCYSLILVINEGADGMITTDSCDFVNLVACSCQVGGEDNDGVQTEAIELTSTLGFIAYDDTEIREELSRLETNKADKSELTELSAEVSGLSEKVDNLPSAESSVFEAVYGETTYDELVAAVKAKKHVICFYNNRVYNLCNYQENKDIFFSCVTSAIYTVSCAVANGKWTASQYNFENTAFKVTSLSSASTDTQYPSAKAVYDFVNNTLGTIINGDY